MALVSAVSLYFLYNALFLNTINRRRELKERQRKQARLAQLGSIREECFQHSIDTDTLILLDNVTDYDQLEKCVLDNMDNNDEESFENLPLLKKRGEGSYVITFPHSVTRQALCELVDDIWCFTPVPYRHGAGRSCSRNTLANGCTFAMEKRTF